MNFQTRSSQLNGIVTMNVIKETEYMIVEWRMAMDSKELVLSVFASVFKVVAAIIIVMLICKGAFSAYEYGIRVFYEPPIESGEGEIIEVTITEKDTVKDIGEKLEKKGLIRDAFLFRMQEALSKYKGELLPGTYELSTAMTAEEMMKIMAEGESE